MRFTVTRGSDGKFQAFMSLPAGDGTLTAAAKGISAAEATVKAARTVKAATNDGAKAPAANNKAKNVAALAKVAANPAIQTALATGGLEAAKLAAGFIPGGAAAVKALELVGKSKVARKLFSGFVKLAKGKGKARK